MHSLRILQLLAALGKRSLPAQLKHGVAEAAQPPSTPAAGLPMSLPLALRASNAPPPPRQAHRKLVAKSGGLQRARGYQALPDAPGTPGHEEGNHSVPRTTLWSELAKSARPAEDPLALPDYAHVTGAQRLDADALKRHPSAYEGRRAPSRNVTLPYTGSPREQGNPGRPRNGEDS